jgi:hypothetical protein
MEPLGSAGPSEHWRTAVRKAGGGVKVFGVRMRDVMRMLEEDEEALQQSVIKESVADIKDRHVVELAAAQEAEVKGVSKGELRAALKRKHDLQRAQLRQQLKTLDAATQRIVSQSMRKLEHEKPYSSDGSLDEVLGDGKPLDGHMATAQQDSVVMMGVYQAEMTALRAPAVSILESVHID